MTRGNPSDWKRIGRLFETIPRARKRMSPEEFSERETQRALAWLAFANEALADLSALAPKWIPKKPGELPDFEEIGAMLAKRRAGLSLPANESKHAKQASAWLALVRKIEEGNRGTAQVLILACATFEKVGDAKNAGEIRDFVRDRWYGFELPSDPPWCDDPDFQRLTFAMARCEAACPTWLREGRSGPKRRDDDETFDPADEAGIFDD